MAIAPTVSVIVPCFRADHFLPLQLEALARQQGAPEFEVLLIDNGENGDLEALAAQWPLLTNVRVVDATDARGAGHARNVGARAARAAHLMFCDADDVVMPTWVHRGHEQLKSCEVFSGGAVPASEELCRRGWHAVVDFVGALEDPPAELPWSGTPDYPILMGGSFGIHRDLMLELGGFDERFQSAAEDNDLGLRVVAAGRRLPDASHVCVAYRIRDQSASFRRGFRAGMNHAMLSARHGLWKVSPAYAGLWPLRPLKAAARNLIDVTSGRSSWRGTWRDDLGRQIGVAAGWIRYRGQESIFAPRR